MQDEVCFDLVARLGFEPRYSDSESEVLPLDDLAVCKTHKRAQYSPKPLNFQMLPDGENAPDDAQHDACHKQNEPQREKILRKIL